MTANNTSRLGLMLPSDTDPFTPADFVNTFNILDGKPGITPIPNLASLPAGLTAAQHMSTYLEADNGALFYWYRPSSGSPGEWRRGNSVGRLSKVINAATVSSTATTAATAAVVATASFTVPGGRPIRLFLQYLQCRSSGSAGFFGVGFNVNGSVFASVQDEHSPNSGLLQEFEAQIDTPVAGTSYTIQALIWTVGSPVQTPGTATVSGGATLLCVEQ